MKLIETGYFNRTLQIDKGDSVEYVFRWTCNYLERSGAYLKIGSWTFSGFRGQIDYHKCIYDAIKHTWSML